MPSPLQVASEVVTENRAPLPATLTRRSANHTVLQHVIVPITVPCLFCYNRKLERCKPQSCRLPSLYKDKMRLITRLLQALPLLTPFISFHSSDHKVISVAPQHLALGRRHR